MRICCLEYIHFLAIFAHLVKDTYQSAVDKICLWQMCFMYEVCWFHPTHSSDRYTDSVYELLNDSGNFQSCHQVVVSYQSSFGTFIVPDIRWTRFNAERRHRRGIPPRFTSFLSAYAPWVLYYNLSWHSEQAAPTVVLYVRASQKYFSHLKDQKKQKLDEIKPDNETVGRRSRSTEE